MICAVSIPDQIYAFLSTRNLNVGVNIEEACNAWGSAFVIEMAGTALSSVLTGPDEMTDETISFQDLLQDFLGQLGYWMELDSDCIAFLYPNSPPF